MPFADLVNRLTAPLNPDPELQHEVRLELLAHLEESAHAHHQAGHSPADAEHLATQSLGDEQTLTQQLATANAPRLRTRRLSRILTLTTLPPLTAALCLTTAASSSPPSS